MKKKEFDFYKNRAILLRQAIEIGGFLFTAAGFVRQWTGEAYIVAQEPTH